MATTTRAAILTKAQRYADLRGTSSGAVLSSADWNALINDARKDLFDLLVAARGQEYFLTSVVTGLTGGGVVAGTSTYTLPSDFYAMGSLTLEWGATEHELVPAIDSLKLLPRINNAGSWDRHGPKGYRLHGTDAGVQSITLSPSPTSSVTARLRYIPVASELTTDSGVGGTLEVVNGFDKLIALTVALEARGILKLPTAEQEKRVAEQRQRIVDMASERTANEPARVVDVDPEGISSPWPSRRVTASQL